MGKKTKLIDSDTKNVLSSVEKMSSGEENLLVRIFKPDEGGTNVSDKPS